MALFPLSSLITFFRGISVKCHGGGIVVLVKHHSPSKQKDPLEGNSLTRDSKCPWQKPVGSVLLNDHTVGQRSDITGSSVAFESCLNNG